MAGALRGACAGMRVPGAAHGFGDERFAEAVARSESFLTWCGVLEDP